MSLPFCSGTTKSDRIRYVRMTSDVVTALEALGQNRQGFVFQRDGQPIEWREADWWLKKTCKLANIPSISWHVLRHTYASQLAIRGASLLPIKDLLGHSSMNTTLRYSHLNQKALAEATALLEPLPEEFSATCCQPEDKSSLFPDRLSENNPQSLAQ